MSAQDTIILKYGQPNLAYEMKWCIRWKVADDFPELSEVFPHPISINKDFKAKLHIAFTALKAKGLLNQLHTFDGCLAHRNTRGSSKTSLHSWALAMDVNAKYNGIKFKREPKPFEHTTFTKAFIDEMVAAGLFWGGYYKSRFDPMHFSMYNA
jgi:hypothetical protein